MSTPALPSLKPLLAGPVPLRALWLSLGSPALVELALQAGADTLVIDLQHGLWDRASLEAALGVARTRLPVIARTADDSAVAIATALDAGAAAVLVPLVESAAQAAGVVRQAHYPPLGLRSGGGVRPLLAAAGGLDELRRSGAHTAVGVMIETAQGVAQAEAICAVPGLDFVFIGTGDLALSLGAGDAPALERACRRVRDAARAHGLPCGLFTPDAAAAARAIADGWPLVVAANDIHLVLHGFQQAVRATATPTPGLPA